MSDKKSSQETAAEEIKTAKYTVGAESKLLRTWREEFSAIHPRFLLMQFFIALLPDNSLNRLRSVLYRIAGVSVGKGTVILGKLNIVGGGRPSVMFRIGENCLINSPLYAELNAPITIGSDVAIGHHVVLITTGHETSCAEHRAGAAKFAPIIIEDGAWVCSGVTILPGVTVGKGSVIAAGSVVPRSVLPNEMVGGVPGRLIKKLEG